MHTCSRDPTILRCQTMRSNHYIDIHNNLIIFNHGANTGSPSIGNIIVFVPTITDDRGICKEREKGIYIFEYLQENTQNQELFRGGRTQRPPKQTNCCTQANEANASCLGHTHVLLWWTISRYLRNG